MKKVLITGGAGFIGKALSKKLLSNNYLVNISSRSKQNNISQDITVYKTINFGSETDWINMTNKVDCVIHCAGKTHVMKKKDDTSLDSYRKVNVEGTINLAKQSAHYGVKRLIFLSSIKVNGRKL